MNQYFVGNKKIRDLLIKSLKNQKVHHALLFSGSNGIGKYTLALYFSRMINCALNSMSADCTCKICKQLQQPWPFHPDFHLLRDVKNPIIVNIKNLISEFQYSSNGKFTEKQLREQYFDFANENLKHEIFLSIKPFSLNKNSNLDVWIPRNSEIKDKEFQKIKTPTSFSLWMYNKLFTYFKHYVYFNSIKISHLRSLQKALTLHPFQARYKIAIIDDAEKMSVEAQNSLLKTLEEPLGDTIIILVTSNPSALLPTIRSRCQPFYFKSLPEREFKQYLLENMELDDNQIELVWHYSQGSMSRLFTTEWDALNDAIAFFDKLFFSEKNVDFDFWLFKLSNFLFEYKEKYYEKNFHLYALQLWLYEILNKNLNDSIQEKNYIQALEKNLDTDNLIDMINLLGNLLNPQNTGLDLKLQFESALYSILCS